MQIYTFCITLLKINYTILKNLYICTILTKQNTIMKHFLRTLFLCLISLTTYATVHQVNSGMHYYTPSELTIHVGDTVVWIKMAAHMMLTVTLILTGKALITRKF